MLFARKATGFTLICLLLLPGVAQAQEPLRPDPESPAGVEYKLPLDQARREALPVDEGSGRPGSGGGSGDAAPLFGAGIEPDGPQTASGDGASADAGEGAPGGGGSQEGGDSEEGGAAGSGDAGPRAGAAAPSLSSSAAEDGGRTGLVLGGIAVAVLLLGGALGLAFRRGLGTTPS